MAKHLGLLLLCLCISIPSALAIRSYLENRQDVYDEGLKILETQGVEDATDYYRQWAQIGDIEGMFGYAWARFQAGEFDKALEFAQFLLQEPDASLTMRARCHYLIGSIQQQKGLFAEAADHYRKGLAFYREHGSVTGIYRTELVLAYTQYWLGKPDEALAMISQTEIPENEPLGFYFFVLGRIHWDLGDADAAAESLQQALRAYEEMGSNSGMVNALAEIGWQKLLQGNRLGIEETKQALDLIPDNDHQVRALVLVNQLLYNRCMGEDTAELEHKIREESQGHHALQTSLNTALNFDCEGD